MEFAAAGRGWRARHMETMRPFSRFLMSQTKGLVLKGGAALALCRGSDRLSDDTGLDAKFPEAAIEPRAKKFAEAGSCSFGAAKNTDAVKRHMTTAGARAVPAKLSAFPPKGRGGKQTR